ncbi:VOC family protein [Sandarakinorhabdus sp. DWP1-3-1]|uniref:VOC family protein n=1 Tax=Sandarakinorhabdus sp. DWP1-3-1 TaxID=2804627 RepID=UPI003CE73767
MGSITPCLWFDTEAEDAARHYVGLFDRAAIGTISRYGENMPRPAGTVLVVEFTLRGQPFMALNGGPGVPFTDAISLSVDCETQDEIDHYWNGLIDGGGQAVQCGWLKDRFGVSWQVAPRMMSDLQRNGTPEQVGRLMQAMMGMVKLDMAALQRAFDGE